MDEQTFADPLNDHITESSFADEREKVVKQIKDLRAHPYVAKVLLAASILLTLFCIHLYFTVKDFDYSFILFSLTPTIIIIGYIYTLQNAAIWYLLCEKHNWVFNPEKNFERPERLAKLFPDIFNRGLLNKDGKEKKDNEKYTSLHNQVWGKIGTGESINFWSCIFHSDQHSSGSGLYDQTAFVIELDDFIPVSFSLFRKGEKSTIQTESVEFNKLFKIKSHEDNNTTEQQIIKALSPSVQVRLIDFANKFSLDCIAFQDKYMVILFEGKVWEAKHTNFYKNVTIDERDIKRFDDLLKEMVALPLEMRKYVN